MNINKVLCSTILATVILVFVSVSGASTMNWTGWSEVASSSYSIPSTFYFNSTGDSEVLISEISECTTCDVETFSLANALVNPWKDFVGSISFTDTIECILAPCDPWEPSPCDPWEPSPSPVPEPATMALVGVGLLGVAVVRRFKQN
jgi:hypothetical protein